MSSSSRSFARPVTVKPLRRESDRFLPSVASARFDEQLTKASATPDAEVSEPTWAEGYEAGIDEGMALGRALTAAEEDAQDRRTGALCNAIAEAADRVTHEQRAIALEARESLVEAAFALAEAIIGRELAERPRSGEEALRSALSLAPEHLRCVARLNPGDLEAMEDVTSRLSHRDVTLVADHTVAAGDCVIDLPAGQIELRLDDALERARAVVLGGADPDDAQSVPANGDAA